MEREDGIESLLEVEREDGIEPSLRPGLAWRTPLCSPAGTSTARTGVLEAVWGQPSGSGLRAMDFVYGIAMAECWERTFCHSDGR